VSRDRLEVRHLQSGRLKSIRVYLTVSALVHFTWEALQLPLYTIWNTGTIPEKAVALAHCTASDLLIATSCLVAALILAGAREWPSEEFLRVAAVAIVLGVLYTAFSEWLNVAVRGSWAYSRWMPLIRLGSVSLGLSPLLQWIVVPTLSFLYVRGTVVGGSLQVFRRNTR
jgi:hypothetical protein